MVDSFQSRLEIKRVQGSCSKLLFVVNEPYFFVSHRLPLALGAKQAGYEIHVAAPNENVWAPEDFETRPFFDDLGISFHEISLSRRGMNVAEEILTLRSMFQLYRRLRPDIVHHITPKAVLYGGLIARIIGVPASVLAFPGLGHYFATQNVKARLIRMMLARGYSLAAGHPNSWAIIQNPDDALTLKNLGVTRHGRTTITRGSGVSLISFSDSELPDGPPLVVLPARMIWEKGVGEFVEVARRLKRSGCEVRFALVGNTHASNPRAVPERSLQAWHEEGVIEWWGRRDDMPRVLSAAHIVCLPSVYGEGIPKVLMEAAACGRAIVTYDVPGCRETVIDGVSGHLVPAGDNELLAEYISKLVTDRTLCRRMGREGRRLAEAEFGIENIVDQTLKVYRNLMRTDEKVSRLART